MLRNSEFIQFETVCRQQQIGLNPHLVEAGLTRTISRANTVHPNGMYSAIIEAGARLRKDPEAPLARKPVTFEPTWEQSDKHTLSRVLGAIVNASVEPASGAADLTTFQCRSNVWINNCPAADGYFAQVFARMAHLPVPAEYAQRRTGYQIITDSGRPIAVRKVKGFGNPLTLNLEPFTVNNVPYPAGSIFTAISSLDTYNEFGHWDSVLPNNGPQRLPAEQISHLGFLRLSAFAVPPQQRRKDFGLGKGVGDSILSFTRYATIGKLQRIAAHALKHTAPYNPAMDTGKATKLANARAAGYY